MRLKLIALSSITVASLALSGCKSDSGTSTMAPEETNILGIYKKQEAAYTYTTSTTIPVSSDDISSRKNYSGDKTTLFWGLITLKDY